jgi:hypothetical protein
MTWHAGWGVLGWTRLPCAVQSVCKRQTHTLPPRQASAVRGRHGCRSHVRIWRLISVDCSASYGIGGLPSTLQRALLYSLLRPQDASRKPKVVQFLGEPIQWVETGRYLGVTLDTQLNWSVHVNQVGKKAAQILGVLGICADQGLTEVTLGQPRWTDVQQASRGCP